MKYTLPMFVLLSAALTGCASIVSGVSQPISVETRFNGEPVAGASCKLSSNKGTWFVTSPGSLTVHRGFQDLLVECSKIGMISSSDYVASSVRALYFGNILFGGIIGLAVDAGDGAGFDYPDLISIDMSRGVGARAPLLPMALPSPTVTTPVAEPAPTTTSLAPLGPAARQIQLAVSANETPPSDTSAVVIGVPGKATFKYMIAAEIYVRERNLCSAIPHASLATFGPGYETYAFACDSGQSLFARCDYGHCHVLQ